MKTFNKLQLIGIGLLFFGIIINFLIANSLIKTIAGLISAIGIGLIFKWIPFNKNE